MTADATTPPAIEIERLQRRIVRARRRATSATLTPWAREVGPDLLCGTAPGRRHWADCYRRASDYVLAHTAGRGDCPPIEGIRLVHGVCSDARGLWAHAWVELPAAGAGGGPLVFDGVRQAFYDWDGYSLVLCALVEATYDAPAMIEQMRASGRYGPWHVGALGSEATRRLELRHRPLVVPPSLG